MKYQYVTFIKKYAEIGRWAIIGLSTFVIDYCVFLGMFHLSNSVLISNFTSGLISIFFNFTGHYFWSFNSGKKVHIASYKYFITLFTSWVLNTIFLKILIMNGIEPKIAKLIPVPISAPLSYLALKFFVFK
jgi:putative flippase GtrA